MTMSKDLLFEPVQMGGMQLKNRIFMAPLTRSRADNPDFAPTELHAEYYRQRATAGLIISEGTVVSPQGVGYQNVPGLHSQAQVDGWKRVTEAVHAEGGHIFAQIWHVGRISHPVLQGGSLPVAPSAVNPGIQVRTPEGKMASVTPHALSASEIAGIVADFARAGANAMAAGFDGVEIHSSNGYLFHQFFNNSSNLRQDGYGGSDENKARFLFETIAALSGVMPQERIGLRLNPMMHDSGGILVDAETAGTFEHIVDRLNDYSLAYLHLTRAPKALDEPWFVDDVIGHFGSRYRGFVVANANYDGREGSAEIAAGRANAIAFGRPFIGNPDLPARLRNDWPLVEADPATYYSPGPRGYTDNPAYTKD